MYYILRYFLVKNEGLEKNIKSEGLDSVPKSQLFHVSISTKTFYSQSIIGSY